MKGLGKLASRVSLITWHIGHSSCFSIAQHGVPLLACRVMHGASWIPWLRGPINDGEEPGIGSAVILVRRYRPWRRAGARFLASVVQRRQMPPARSFNAGATSALDRYAKLLPVLQSLLVHLTGQPFSSIQPHLNVEREPSLDSCIHPSHLRMDLVLVNHLAGFYPPNQVRATVFERRAGFHTTECEYQSTLHASLGGQGSRKNSTGSPWLSNGLTLACLTFWLIGFT
jgi:hypothetical protein